MKASAVAAAISTFVITVGLGGCSVAHRVTTTQNGATATDTATPAPVSNVDACKALTPQSLDKLGLSNITPVPINDPDKTGCDWSGTNDYVTPSMTLWVRSASVGDPSNDTVIVAGKEIQVYTVNTDGGRYIAICGKRSVTINYTRGKGPLGPKDGLDLTMKDAVAAYHCT